MTDALNMDINGDRVFCDPCLLAKSFFVRTKSDEVIRWLIIDRAYANIILELFGDEPKGGFIRRIVTIGTGGTYSAEQNEKKIDHCFCCNAYVGSNYTGHRIR